MVLTILGIVWAVVIVSYLREKTATTTGDSVSAFRDQLTTLQRTQPGRDRVAGRAQQSARPALATRAHSGEARRRRRDVLFTLVGVAGFTFIVALFNPTMPFILLNVVSVLAAVGFIALLVSQQRIATEQAAKVRPLRAAGVRTVPVSYQPRAAVGGQRMR